MTDTERSIRSLRAAALTAERQAQRAILAAWRTTWGTVTPLLDALFSVTRQARLQGVRLTLRWFHDQYAYRSLLAGLSAALGRFATIVGAVVASARNMVAAAIAPLAAGVVGALTGLAAAALTVAPLVPGVAPLALVAGLVKDVPRIVAAIGRALRTAIGRNLPARQVVSETRQAANEVPVRALATSRANVHEAAREATLATYRLHPEALSGWRWRSARTARTCAICWSRDGQIFPLSRGFASHPGCRCVCEPLSRGATPIGETGPEAFARLSPDTQRAILGPGKHNLYLDGMLTLDMLPVATQSARYGPGLRERSLRELRAR